MCFRCGLPQWFLEWGLNSLSELWKRSLGLARNKVELFHRRHHIQPVSFVREVKVIKMWRRDFTKLRRKTEISKRRCLHQCTDMSDAFKVTFVRSHVTHTNTLSLLKFFFRELRQRRRQNKRESHKMTNEWNNNSERALHYVNIRQRSFLFLFMNLDTVLNHLSPNSDQHETSPYDINALESRVVMRIEHMIREEEYNWCFNKFSPLLLLKKYRES